MSSCQSENNPQITSHSHTIQNIKLDYAQNFSVRKEGNLTIINIKTPWKNAAKKIEYVLYPKEQAAPTQYPDASLIAVPVSKIICSSTIDIAFLDALGASSKIVAISNGNYIYNPKIRAALAEQKILDIGGNNTIDYEKALTTEADIALVYSIGAENHYNKFNSLGIPTVLVSDFMETSPLGRAEWLRFIAYFVGLENQADSIFNHIKNQYQQIKIAAQKESYQPTVLTGAVYNGTWHIAGGKSLMAQLIKDAGGRYLWADNEEVSGVPLDFEAVYTKALTVDCWLNISYYKTKKELLAADHRYQDFKAVKEGQIFNHFKRMTDGGGSDVFESAIVQPHLLLQDFVHIFHSKKLVSDSLYYYLPLE